MYFTVPYAVYTIECTNILIFGGGAQLCGLETGNLLTFEFLKATETSAYIIS